MLVGREQPGHMNVLRFQIPLGAARALLAEDAFGGGDASRFEDPILECDLKYSDSAGETQIGCSAGVAAVILLELRRLVSRSAHDAELSFALTQAVITVQRAVTSHHEGVSA
jgi:hypothetical protein